MAELDPDDSAANLNEALLDAVRIEGGVKRYTEAVGDGAATSIAVTHSLGTRDVTVHAYDASTYEEVIPDVERTDVNTVTLTFGSAPTTGQYQVVVVG